VQVEDDVWSITYKHKLTVRNIRKCIRLQQKGEILSCGQKEIGKMFTKTDHKRTASGKHKMGKRSINIVDPF
jgi:hypothetical protein